MQADRLLEEQVKRKDAILRKWKKLTKSDLAVFQTLHPDLCQKGHIHYPIEDLLLNSRPRLHGLKGKPLPLTVPDPWLCDLLRISDFMHVFRNVLKAPCFSPIQLKLALELPQETSLLKDILLSLLSVCLTSMGKRNITDKAIRFRFAEKLNIDLLPHLSLYYLFILEDVIWSWSFEDDYQTVLTTLQIEPAESHFYSSYSVEKKIAVLKALVDIALCSKVVRDEVQKIGDEFRKLTKLRKDLKSKCKFDKSLQIELEKVERQLTDTHIGPWVLGQDRDFREYFYSGCDKSGLYVKGMEEQQEIWRYLDYNQCQVLLSALHSKGTREKRLKSAITVVKLMDVAVQKPTPLGSEERLNGVKSLLLSLESQLSTSFQTKKYIWTLPDQAETWRQAVYCASSDFHLKGLFQQFIEKATNPYVTLKGGELRQVQAKYSQSNLQQEWVLIGEAALGPGALAFQILTFLSACHIRLKRVRREDYEDEEPEKQGKWDIMDSP